ncbi:MerR family transcriptional regulator [Streptomyces sp. NPDC051561]|uniref:MerR family transcriptional regulator n=1 Tax=Streptomyces sp. NPDC051561 TaxID=3365658 RepID=UPI0037BAB2A4
MSGGHGDARQVVSRQRDTQPSDSRPLDSRQAVSRQADPEYRIEDLAHLSGATVRTIRAYQDRGLLPKPERRGRANVYGDAHLARLRQIADLLERGYTLASIKELLEAWDAGRGLGGVLGLVAEVGGPWTDEEAGRISRAELDERFGGRPDDSAVADAVELGVLERVPGRDDEFLVPSPQELAVAAELYAAGVPLRAISGHLWELRGQVEHIAARFLEFTTEHVFARYLEHRPPTDADAAEAAALVRRLRPLAQQSVDAELARAMRLFATRHLQEHLGAVGGQGPVKAVPPEPQERTRTSAASASDVELLALPQGTIAAVQALVGAENVSAFVTAATEREVQARALDALTPTQPNRNKVD